MSKETEGNQNNPRRNFLKEIGIAALGVGAVAGGAAIISAKKIQEKKAAHAGEHGGEHSGEKVKVMTTDGQTVEVDPNQLQVATEEENLTLSEKQARGQQGIPGKKWVMVIDLAKCRNARACMAACQNAHHLRPEQHHINVYRMQDAQDTAPYFMPKPCYHCDNPPCTKVCPVNATWKRPDGIVLIDNERCIGCRFCIAGCPYSARVFNWVEPYTDDRVYNDFLEPDERKLPEPELKKKIAEKRKEIKDTVYDVELNVPQKKGTISKCLFSADRLRQGMLPYCVSACPNGVYWFGDKNEDAITNGLTGETVRFSELVKEKSRIYCNGRVRHQATGLLSATSRQEIPFPV
jgi:Fe-S-cluster-containing dehydrogenase component